MIYCSVLGADLLELENRNVIQSCYPENHIIGYIPHYSKEILISAELIAEQSMANTRIAWRQSCSKRVHAIYSYDGAYQMRSGMSCGVFGCYYFASAVPSTSKVLSNEVICNSCRMHDRIQ